MKTIKLLVSTAMVATSLSPLAVSPAYAAVDTTYGTHPALDQMCSDLQKPDDASGFTSFAVDVTTGTPSSLTVDDGPSSTVGIGPSTFTIGNYRDAHVNGQSVNIHAYGDKVTTYAGGATKTTPTKTTTTTTTSAKCHVHKPTNGNQNDPDHLGYQIAPNGLQTDDPVSTTSTSVTYGSRTETIAGPWIDPNATQYGAEFVICISPSQPPPKGTWRGQNGYVSQLGRTCSTVWHNSLGSSQPTASLPPV